MLIKCINMHVRFFFNLAQKAEMETHVLPFAQSCAREKNIMCIEKQELIEMQLIYFVKLLYGYRSCLLV